MALPAQFAAIASQFLGGEISVNVDIYQPSIAAVEAVNALGGPYNLVGNVDLSLQFTKEARDIANVMGAWNSLAAQIIAGVEASQLIKHWGVLADTVGRYWLVRENPRPVGTAQGIAIICVVTALPNPPNGVTPRGA